MNVTAGVPGDPATLANLLPPDGSNVFLRTLDTVAQKLIDLARTDGTLERQVKKDHPNSRIDTAHAHFKAGAFVAEISGHLVDECPANVDLYFNARRTMKVDFLGSQIQIKTTQDQDLWDSNNWLCLLTAGGPLLLATIGFGWFNVLWFTVGSFLLTGSVIGLGGKVETLILNSVKDAIFGGTPDEDPPPINLTTAIPGTDYLPSIQAAMFAIENGALIITAAAGRLPDNLSTYLYARFLVPHISLHDGTPLAGARVLLVDQDAPPPAGDDVTLRDSKPTITVRNNVMTTITRIYEPATQDEVLIEGQTDISGMPRFVITEDRRTTTAGHAQTTIHQVNLVNAQESTSVSHPVVFERLPDLYFRVYLPNGTVVDSRNSKGGLFRNAGAMRLGSFANPLTFLVTGNGLVRSDQVILPGSILAIPPPP